MTKAQSKSDPNGVYVSPRKDESTSDAIARYRLRPSVNGAITSKAYGAKYGNDLELGALITALSAQAEAAQRGDLKRAEGMLLVQAHTLDAIFNELAQRAASNMGEYINATDTYLRLALKAQSQCRATLEALAAIKYPTPVAFVRQANIAAGPQQVNNGVPDSSHAREIEIEQSKLLEAEHGQRLDSRAAATTGRANQSLETLGEVNRTSNRRGQSQGGT